MPSITIPGGNIECSGFQHCCGINIYYGFTSNAFHNQATNMPNEAAKKALESQSKGISLIVLTHIQWENNPELLKYLKSIGYYPVIEDFHNSNTSHQLTLFAKIHYPKAMGISAAWRKIKKQFNW